ncbi:hypothetical protein [Halostagnicola sp. A-GB9-2]|uniref:hypothetical protein n=1 Tax=Halostagnicola sp. A-GB9-2 TaxID=3048066 RepID=UPI0024BFD002|nr:hypothetical protein [Halostagnicola sp. A-GB9-2]MDJ1434269.1 hypothetical protein [Halostagnicola sp. A-GB9-2]
MARKRKRNRSRSGGGISRRSLLLLVGTGAVGTAGAYTTGAFDLLSADRAFDIGTAVDENALLEIDIEEPSGGDGDTVTLFEVTNRFGSELTSIEAEIVDGVDAPVDPNSLRTPAGLPPGASDAIEGDLSCSGGVGTMEVSVSASSPEQSVDLTRSVQVSCTRPGQDVCAPRDPPGCTDENFPAWGGTDCSVVIHTSGEVSEQIGGGIDVGGAVDIRTDDEVDVTHHGSVADYFSIDTGAKIELSMGGGATIGGPLQLSTSDEVIANISGTVGGGFCADEAGELDVIVGSGGTVDGAMSLGSTDEVTVDLSGDASVGPLSVETTDEVHIDVSGGSEIDGSVDVDTSDEVMLTMSGNERIRDDVTVTTDDEVNIDLSGSSVIEGNVTVETTDEVSIELKGNSSIEGNVTVETTDEVEISDCSSIGGSVTPESTCDG